MSDKLAALPLVRHDFPKESAQAVIAAQPALRRVHFQCCIGRCSRIFTFGIMMTVGLLIKMQEGGTAIQTSDL